MTEKYFKIVQLILVIMSFVVGYTARVLFEFSATVAGSVAKIYAIESVRHGIPIALGIAVFLFFQLNPKIKKWLYDVVTEVDKVVWPTKKDTLSMTVVVCIILIVSGIVLGLFDVTAGTVLQYILN